MADYDSFKMPKKSVKGKYAPIVTNKLAGPSDWKEYDTYIIKPGEADICFPIDFDFLAHAASVITG